MADESDFERTEPASPRRLEQARLAGRVVRSTEVVSLALLAASSAALLWLMPAVLHAFAAPFADALSFNHTRVFSDAMVLPDLQRALAMALLLVGVIIAIVILATLAVGGFIFAPAVLQFDSGRLSPAHGFARLFSLASAFEGLRVTARLAAVLMLIFIVIMVSDPPAGGVSASTGPAAEAAFEWAGRNLLILAAALSALTALEIFVRHWLHQRAERMTRVEVLQEYREAEGRPELKAQIDARRRAFQARKTTS